MIIHNVRLGFATNSSSTHSLVFIKGAAHVNDVCGPEFGWDFFTASSREAKTDYLAITLRDNLSRVVSEDIADLVTDSWVGPTESKDGYVDHQSMMTLPRTWDGKGIDRGFFADFKEFLLRDDVAILGGNDNTEEKHSLSAGAFTLPLEMDNNNHAYVARRDGDHWSLFNRETGTKIRMSFAAPGETVVPTKASAPELVDLKITDFCEAGCSYCYQGSTVQGKHAAVDDLYSVASMLRDMRVFEVAIGGGEPTAHPDFIKILELFREKGVVPNFTTRAIDWLEDPKRRHKILPLIGGFAFSADNRKEIDRLANAIKVADFLVGTEYCGGRQVNIQYVMGAHDLERLDEIVGACREHNFTLVLLGYKTTGRGADRPPKPYAGWVERLQGLTRGAWMRIGVDTALAAQSSQELLKAVAGDRDGARIFFTTEEGKFSMYIDAVAKKMGPSSYCEPLRMKPLPRYGHDDVIAAFAGW